jgi:hypothetical protein
MVPDGRPSLCTWGLANRRADLVSGSLYHIVCTLRAMFQRFSQEKSFGVLGIVPGNAPSDRTDNQVNRLERPKEIPQIRGEQEAL